MSVSNRYTGVSSLNCVVEVVHKPLKEKGEDAFAYSFENALIQSQAVFDGCGGAGSWQYDEYKKSTGAFIAAQSMAKAYSRWIASLTPEILTSMTGTKESFQIMADHVLQNLKSSCAPMRISGSLVKSFPCTASAAVMVPGEGSLSLTTLNVGDSRVYLLVPQRGLIQITVDDSQGNPDPLEALRESAPLSDMLNADKPFEVKCRRLNLSSPCAVMTATDGVFGYFRSPMDFEYVVLHALLQAESFAQFERLFKEAVIEVTGDDSTCIMSFYGWNSLDEVKDRLRNRYETVLAMKKAMDDAGNERLDAVMQEIWDTYRKQTLFDEMEK